MQKDPEPGESRRQVEPSMGMLDDAHVEERLRSLRDALRAAGQGDFSVRLPTNGGDEGLVGEVVIAFNVLVKRNRALSRELERVSRVVGGDGQLSERASLGQVSGAWADSVESLNSLIDSIAFPVSEATRTLNVVAKGDLSREMPLHVERRALRGDFLALGTGVNQVVGTLRSVSTNVSRVVQEIGSEGKLGMQASSEDLTGTWKSLIDDVNALATNMTAQVRSIALVSAAIANGDLSQKVTVETRGEFLELKNTINATVDQLRSFAAEVIRVAREVGTEGRLGAQADVRGVSGVWQELTNSVNHLASNLTSQVRNIAQFATAVAGGDLSQKITVEAKGEVLELKNTLNRTVDQLQAIAAEVTRVAREVGTEGRLGAQADVRGVSGTWKDLTDSVNMLAGNLTDQVRNVAAVATAIANGDLSQKITVEAKGEILELKNTINGMVDRLQAFAAEVTRVAREVGTEGKLGGQADVKGVSGTWKDLTGNVNLMARNLTDQVRGIAIVVTAVASGDLSQKFVVEAKGEIAALADTINNMTDALRTFADQVTTVAREVGIEGKLGGQAKVPGVSGTWRDLTDNVNLLAGNLTNQVRNIALVTTAVANGDLSQKITVEAKGEILELKDTVNAMVEQLRIFASEVTRVAKEVGTEGKLGGQAVVPGGAGTWKDLTENVNVMALNLTNQVRGIAKVVTAVADGDLSQKFVVEAKGEIAFLADTINDMTDTLRTFAAQVTTVAREVGIEGKLGGQANVPGVSGTWKDLTDNVNMLAGNLTNQVRNIALVSTAIANGDLSQKITVEAQGEILELKNTINAMVEQLRTFAKEVTRVAREVGTDGKLGGQALVPGVAGTWQELTENVNLMAGNLTSQVRGIARVVTAVANGNLGQKLVLDVRGEIAALADTINDMTDTLRTFAEQVTTVAREVGIEGKLGGQALVPGAAGTWRDLTDSVNMLAGNLTSQVRNIALVTTAVANGDLSKKISVEAKGEIQELKDTINGMVEQLRTFAAEVTRVAREVGTDGQLGGQARVPGVSGTWKDLTDNVNVMASNLTDQVRGISKVVTAVANGELTGKLVLVAKGEIATLADTINDMTETLRTFAEQVTTVAREVGVDGKLGGQAKVPGAAGTWRDLVDNVNQLAGNLTTQVRAIFDVATAVTKGDLTRTIDVSAQGEVLSLKDTINEMIANLRDTTRTNREQDWLKTNLAKFSSMMQGQRSLDSLAQLIMSELTPVVSAQIGTFFVVDQDRDKSVLKLLSSYGHTRRKNVSNRYGFGEGLVGQAALEKKPILVTRVPDDYVPIASSIGEAPARNLVVFPILFEGSVRGVVELGSFEEFSPIHLTFLEQLALNMGVVFNMISASRLTEELLEELKGSNAELGRRSTELEDKAGQLELKNREIAEASANLEEKAAQLALVSKYKSEFLANMSHELRTPLNSMMILSDLLVENVEGTLTDRQVEYARTIQTSGRDLIGLISQILDLSKIEAGSVEVERTRVPLEDVRLFVEQSFRPIAVQKNLAFGVRIAPGTPETLVTDPQRVQQILRNLLSNAFKFTERGSVDVRIGVEGDTRRFQSEELRAAPAAMSFAVIDTGIGIAPDKRQFIFEAFQQADATTSRIYGGTGLGLTISRELSHLLGGELHLDSTVGEGSTFTLYLPLGDAEPTFRAGGTRPSGFHPKPHRSLRPHRTAHSSSSERPSSPGAAAPHSARRSPRQALAPYRSEEGGAASGAAPGAFPDEGVTLPGARPSAISDLPPEPFGEREATREMAPVPIASAPTGVTPTAARSSEDISARLAGRRVLVVDDDARNLFALTSLLERYGARVLPAGSAQDAFDLLDQNTDIALIFMDMMMPEVDGYEATRRLRSTPRYRDMPIIALTAKTMPGDRERAIEAGCDDFVPKPVDSQVLFSVLARWMSAAPPS